MKTGTAALVSVCLVGQALAAPAPLLGLGKDEITGKLEGLTGGLTENLPAVNDLLAALKDLGLEDIVADLVPAAGTVPQLPKRGLQELVDRILSILGLVRSALPADVLDQVTDKVGVISNTATPSTTRVTELSSLLTILDPFLGPGSTVGGLLEALTGGATSPVTGTAGGVVGGLLGAVGGIAKGATGGLPVKLPVKRGVDDDVNTVLKNLGLSTKDLNKDTLKTVEDKVKEITSGAGTPVSRLSLVGGLLAALRPLLGGILPNPTDLLAGLPLGNAAGGAFSSSTSIVSGLGSTANSVAGKLPKRSEDAGVEKREPVLGAVGELLKALGLDGVVAGVKAPLDEIVKGVTAPLDGATGGAVSGATGTVQGVVSGATGAVGSVVGNVAGNLPKLPVPKEKRGTEPIKVIFDELSEVTTILVDAADIIPDDQAEVLKKTINDFFGSLAGILGRVPALP